MNYYLQTFESFVREIKWNGEHLNVSANGRRSKTRWGPILKVNASSISISVRFIRCQLLIPSAFSIRSRTAAEEEFQCVESIKLFTFFQIKAYIEMAIIIIYSI